MAAVDPASRTNVSAIVVFKDKPNLQISSHESPSTLCNVADERNRLLLLASIPQLSVPSTGTRHTPVIERTRQSQATSDVDVSKTIMLWTRYSRPDEQNLKTIRADYENKSENIVPLKSIS